MDSITCLQSLQKDIIDFPNTIGPLFCRADFCRDPAQPTMHVRKNELAHIVYKEKLFQTSWAEFLNFPST